MGLMLVGASVALGSALVSGAARTVPVWAAAEPLVVGDAVTADAVTVRQVRLGAAAAGYLSAEDPLTEGLVAVRTVGAGELVPASAVAPEGALAVRPVAITPDGALPSDLAEGATVDLWFVPDPPPTAGGRAADPAGDEADPDGAAAAAGRAPRELARGLTVAEVTETRDGFTVGGGATVHVLVPLDQLPAVLTALAADGAVQVVLVPGA